MDYINPNYFEIKADVNDENINDFDNFKPWTIEYKIPFEFTRPFSQVLRLNQVKL